MSKFILSASIAMAMLCGAACVQADYPRSHHHGGHGGHHHHHHHGSYHQGHHHHHHHHNHHGGYYGRQSYYPTPYSSGSNYLGLRFGNFNLNFGSTPNAAPNRNGYYYRGY